MPARGYEVQVKQILSIWPNATLATYARDMMCSPRVKRTVAAFSYLYIAGRSVPTRHVEVRTIMQAARDEPSDFTG